MTRIPPQRPTLGTALTKSAFGAALLGLAACGGTTNGSGTGSSNAVPSTITQAGSTSRFGSATNQGDFNLELVNKDPNSTITQEFINIPAEGVNMHVGFAHFSGIEVTGNTANHLAIAGYAGDFAKSDLTTAPTTGTGTYSGDMSMRYIDRSSSTSLTADDTIKNHNVGFTLSADFDADTFSGQTTENPANPMIEVTGTISGNDLSGTVDFDDGTRSMSSDGFEGLIDTRVA
ncbi:MAG: transferrin-binding protein-like solute binding protein, partial [Paracoccaceae bacterium]